MNNFNSKINFKVLIIVFLALLILFGGVLKFLSRKSHSENEFHIRGNFINYSFLNQTNNKIISKIPFYAVEFNFYKQDSVLINFGFENAKYRIEQDHGKIFIRNAFNNKDLQILLADSSFLVLIDSSYTKIKESSVFKKIENDRNNNFVFSSALNKELVSGNYSLKIDSKNAETKVTFLEDGRIIGLNNFTNYELCFAGDCTCEVTDDINLISFFTASDSMFYFGFKKEWDKVEFYNLSPAIKYIKGERRITNLAFTLYKSKL